MASDPPKRSDNETESETVKRRLIDTVREQLDEIDRGALEQREIGLPRQPDEAE